MVKLENSIPFSVSTRHKSLYGQTVHCISIVPKLECLVRTSNLKRQFTLIFPFNNKLIPNKDVMQGKLFQKCTHLLYCSVLSLGGNVNTRRMSKPDMGSILNIKKSMKYSGHGNYYVNYQNLMLLTSSDTKRTLMPPILVYKIRPTRTGFNMYVEYTRPQLTFLALHP